ncbi:MAG: hypothetical protein JJ879_00940 [Sneathiella sp.]|nr:hypothetical protein [Sneathiella sp.]
MRWLLIVLFAFVGIFELSNDSEAKPVCGGIEANGQLQPACKSQPGKLAGAPVLSCPAGQIYDLEACWTCPAGFERSADSIATKTACTRVTNKDVFGDVRQASRIPNANFCPSGSFFDLYNGGGCWSCPGGYRRTIFPVFEDKACEKGDIFSGIKWAPANFRSATCGSDNAFFDLTDGGSCWSCPAEYVRTVFPVTGPKACGRPIMETKPATQIKKAGCKAYGEDAFWDPRGTNGTVIGSCWTCPADYTRTTEAVDSPYACAAPAIIWDVPKLPRKGLFLLDGAAEVAVKLIKERHQLEKVAVDLGKQIGLNRQDAIDALWREIGQYPEENLALRYVMLKHILNIALDNTKTVPGNSPEGRLIRAFEGFISGYKLYLAQESLNAYDNWYAAQQLALKKRNEENARQMRSNMLMLFTDQMPVPPDFRQVVARSALINMAAATPTIGLFASNFISLSDGTLADEMTRRIFVNRTDSFKGSVDDVINSADEIGDVSRQIFGQGDDVAAMAKNFTGAIDDIAKTAATASKSAVSAGKLATKILGITGPGIAIEFFMLAFEAELTTNLEKADARPKLVRYLEQAKNYKPSLRTISQNKSESAKIFSYWALATTGDARPSGPKMAQIGQAADANLSGHTLKVDPLAFDGKEWTWYNVAGEAKHISSGLSGDVWHVAADGSVYHANANSDKSWQKTNLKNVAKIASLPTSRTAFVLNDKGGMRVFQDGRVSNVPGWAADIAVNARGVKWHIGGSNSVYMEDDNGGWRRITAPKAKKIAAGPGDIAWIVDTNNNLHYHYSGKWTNAQKKAKDVAVGAAGDVWIAGEDDQAYRLIYNNRWEPLDAGNVDRVASVSVGMLWALRPNNHIILYQHDQQGVSPLAQKGGLRDTSQTTTNGGDIAITPIIIDKDKIVVTTYTSTNGPKKPKWREVAGWASQISTGPSGDVWHIGGSGSVYVRLKGKTGWKDTGLRSFKNVQASRLSGKAFGLDENGAMWDIWESGRKTQVPGWASDIAIDSNDVKWHIGGNSTIYKMGPNGWVQIPGNLSKVAAGKDGALWTVGLNREIYRFDNGKWLQEPGEAFDVAVGADGSIWHIGGSNSLYKLTDKGWEGVDAQKASNLSVGPKGEVWIVRPNGSMAVFK